MLQTGHCSWCLRWNLLSRPLVSFQPNGRLTLTYWYSLDDFHPCTGKYAAIFLETLPAFCFIIDVNLSEWWSWSGLTGRLSPRLRLMTLSSSSLSLSRLARHSWFFWRRNRQNQSEPTNSWLISCQTTDWNIWGGNLFAVKGFRFRALKLTLKSCFCQ